MELIIILVLILTSIVGLTFIFERGFALRWRKVIPSEVEAALAACRSAADLPNLHHVCLQYPSPLSRLLLTAESHRDWPKADNAAALQTRARHELVGLERGLVVLEIIVGIAPLLGLVGTIYGLIILFGNMGQTGMTDNATLSRGIALALNATFMGLVTAIPSLVAWSYYNKKVETLSIEMESLCDELLRRIYSQEDNDARR